jgi:hypothetical protein
MAACYADTLEQEQPAIPTATALLTQLVEAEASRAQGQFWWRFGGGFEGLKVLHSPTRCRTPRRCRASPLQSTTAIASHARGQRFESSSAHHSIPDLRESSWWRFSPNLTALATTFPAQVDEAASDRDRLVLAVLAEKGHASDWLAARLADDLASPAPLTQARCDSAARFLSHWRTSASATQRAH